MKFYLSIMMSVLMVGIARTEDSAEEHGAKTSLKPRRIVFVAGDVDAPYGLNEFHAGSLLLAKSLREIRPELETKVYNNAWPEDAEIIEEADALVIYAVDDDPLINAHRKDIGKAVKEGVGVVSILYDIFKFNGIKKKDVQRWGHMDYEQKQYNLFTPVLTHLQDDNTFTVNQLLLGVPAVSKDSRHHYIVGGHWHWAWGQTFYRRLTMQCIIQAAGQTQKWGGFKVRNLTFAELQENLDVEPPEDFDLGPIKWHVEQWNQTADERPLPSPWWNNDLRAYDVAEEDDRGTPIEGGEYEKKK